MKTKIVLVMLMLASMAYEASAIKIVISGGGRAGIPKFKTIIMRDDVVKCLGNGNNVCPVNFAQVQEGTTGTWYPMGDVVDLVIARVNDGHETGSLKYKGNLPVSWKMQNDEDIEIDIVESGIRGLEKYDVK